MTAPPSRNLNPFATCWTRPGAIPFHFPDGHSTERLISRLATLQWRGAIVGPHGSGKSTLLETLKPALTAAGVFVHAITLRDRQRRLPASYLAALPKHSAMMIVDGYEQLGLVERLRLKWRCRRTRCGLLVTAHFPTNLPTLIRLAPDEELVQRLVARLTAGSPFGIARDQVAASLACHGANVREIFFELYDRHESARAERTIIRCTA